MEMISSSKLLQLNTNLVKIIRSCLTELEEIRLCSLHKVLRKNTIFTKEFYKVYYIISKLNTYERNNFVNYTNNRSIYELIVLNQGKEIEEFVKIAFSYFLISHSKLYPVTKFFLGDFELKN